MDKEKISKELDEYNKLAMAICLQYKVSFVDLTETTREAASNGALLTGDGLHPSAKAYSVWARHLSELFAKGLKNNLASFLISRFTNAALRHFLPSHKILKVKTFCRRLTNFFSKAILVTYHCSFVFALYLHVREGSSQPRDTNYAEEFADCRIACKSQNNRKNTGPDFEVKSCFGHIRDLTKDDMGIDIKTNTALLISYRRKSKRWSTN
jgi:hypothetical protein